MNLVYPTYWTWFLAIPVSLGIIFLVYKRVSFITETWFTTESYARSFPFTKFLLRAAAYLLLFVALLGPYWGEEKQMVNVMGREIYFLIDVSASMNVEDIKPSRLDKVKSEVQRMIEELKGDKIGLIIFSDNSYVQCPLTTDHQAVLMFLELISSQQFAQTGTNFRAALAMALSRFQGAESSAKHVSRAVVLISDGEDFGDTYTSIIDRFNESHINVFTVGVGTYDGDPIPDFDRDGRRIGFKKHEDGTIAISQIQEEDLRNIAINSGTTYLHIVDQEDNLQLLQEQITSLSSSPLISRMEQIKNNRFQIFLGFSVVLLMISLFIMPTRKDENQA